jgi:hypothetical protein
MHTINLDYLLSLLKRWYYSRQKDRCSLTQGQANQIYQNPPFKIETTAASLINVIWFTAFYSSVLPLGIVFSLGCFIYEYFIIKVNFKYLRIFPIYLFLLKKHMLIKRSTVLHEMGTNLAEGLTDLIEISLVWFGVQHCFFIISHIFKDWKLNF